MKALSTVYGTYVASLMMLLLTFSLWTALSTIGNELSSNMSEYTEKLETLINKPIMRVKLVNNTLYLEIHTYKPIKIAYMIIEYLNGTTIFEKVNKIVYNTSTFKILSPYNGSPIKIGLILDNGAVIYYDPRTDPSINMFGTTYIDETAFQATQSSNNHEFIINPTVGWAFNKSLIITDGDNIYYLLPVLVGDYNWSQTVLDTGYKQTYSGTIKIKLRDTTNNKLINKLRGVFANDLRYVDAYIDYE
ncbi:MAG: hypothetical protein J7L82_07045, partial [Staphylothermus sp.]|nr:hypothetical protein [Staphylothermus sp.]